MMLIFNNALKIGYIIVSNVKGSFLVSPEEI